MKVTSDKVWPPGFRFHPTDEELVLYYLKRKICKRRIKIDIITELDVYKWDPEELPGQSLLKTGDRQWFFFSPRDRKYPNGARSNRATRQGYWKATGKDRNITCNSRNVGVKKTLVFYRGRAPNGERTDWVMHEYTLDEEELNRCQNIQDYYALYKVFKKSGPGPKNGEQYGAPFKEEEWVDDEDLDVTITVDSKIPTKHLNVTITVDSKIPTKHLNVTNTVDSKIPTKQPSRVAAVDNLRSGGQEPSPLDDIEVFINQLADEPLPSELPINYAYDAPQAVGEEETTVVNPSSREVVFSKPISVFSEQASFDFTQSASSNLQLYEASEVTSVPNNSEQVLQICEEDFLEIDDLVGPEPTPSTVEKPVENLQFDEFDGLSELDLFHDASMFLRDLGTVDQETIANVLGNDMVNQEENQFQSQSMLNQMDHQLQPSLLVNQMDHQLQPTSGLVHQSTNHPTEANQNQSGQQGGRATSWISSSLWAFVESIPTAPASASESPLVNRAFERMSSFSRMRITARNINVTGGEAAAVTRRQSSSNRGFLLLSVFGALCAILWMLMGTMRVLGGGIFSW